MAMGPSFAGARSCSDAMTPWPITIRPDAPLSEAVRLVIRHRIRHLPVVDATSTLVGMVSERDLREAIGDPVDYLAIEPKLVTEQPRVRDVMSAPVVSVRFDTSLSDLAGKFTDRRVGAIPVTDGFGALIGIVSYVDALRVLAV